MACADRVADEPVQLVSVVVDVAVCAVKSTMTADAQCKTVREHEPQLGRRAVIDNVVSVQLAAPPASLTRVVIALEYSATPCRVLLVLALAFSILVGEAGVVARIPGAPSS